MQIAPPEFFVVGAPKCGTTALYRYLSEHPSVFMPELKEPHYFSLDFPEFGKVKTWKDYQMLFASAPSGSMTGEASVWYLFSERAIPEILARRPDAKFIALLRNPVDMARSLHRQLVIGLREDIWDFETAWRVQADRADGCRLPAYCPEPRHLQYREVCGFLPQIERMLRHIPAGQRKILVYEDFFSDVATGYRQALQFLGLPDDGRTEFPIVNEASAIARPGLYRFLARPPLPLRCLHVPMQRLARAMGLRLVKMLREHGTRPEPNEPLRPGFERELYESFEPDVGALEKLLGRSLDRWKLPASGGAATLTDTFR